MGVPAVVSTPDSQFLIEEIFLSRDTNSAHHNTKLIEILQRAPDYGCGGYRTEDAHRISWKLTAEGLKAASRHGGQNDCPAGSQRAKRK